MFQTTHFQIVARHVRAGGARVPALRGRPLRQPRSAARATPGLVPPPKLGLRNLFEVLADTVLGLMAASWARRQAQRYLPLVGTLFIFILFSNLFALIPGFLPPTDTLKTNVGSRSRCSS